MKIKLPEFFNSKSSYAQSLVALISFAIAFAIAVTSGIKLVTAFADLLGYMAVIVDARASDGVAVIGERDLGAWRYFVKAIKVAWFTFYSWLHYQHDKLMVPVRMRHAAKRAGIRSLRSMRRYMETKAASVSPLGDGAF